MINYRNYLASTNARTKLRINTYYTPNRPQLTALGPHSCRRDRPFDTLVVMTIRVWLWCCALCWHQTSSYQRAFTSEIHREESSINRGRLITSCTWALDGRQRDYALYSIRNHRLRLRQHADYQPESLDTTKQRRKRQIQRCKTVCNNRLLVSLANKPRNM